MEIVMSLGGSIIIPREIDTNFLKKFRELVLEFAGKGNKIVIVAGGGYSARQYQSAAREISGASDIDLDRVGVASTRLNAELLRAVFGDEAYEEVVGDPSKMVRTERNIIIGAGWQPGASSDNNAVIIAGHLGIKTFVNLSNIEYVYDKDPNKFKDAKKFERMSWGELKAIVGEKWEPGRNVPFDPIAAKAASSLGMKVIVMKGTDLDNLKSFLEGRSFKGTIIQ